MVNKKSPEQIQKEKNEIYLRGKPSRMEVSSYVNNLLENKYMPMISENVNALKLGNMVLQSILIQKGICTKEEIENMVKQFVEISKQECLADNPKEENQ